MSDAINRRMMALYESMASPLMFLSGFFQTPAGNFHNSEEVEIDVIRGDEDVAIVIHDLSTGFRMNSDDLYTNKAFKPPVFQEAFAINSHDLLKRAPGSNPFENVSFRSNLARRMLSGMQKVDAKIRRAIELQAAQVLQSGVLTLIDSAGTTLYSLTFSPKTTHFPTSAQAWGSATGAQKMGHLMSLAEVIRNDGLQDPDQLIFGIDAFENFISDSAVQSRLDTRRLDVGSINPMQRRGQGGTYHGRIDLGHYQYEIWTYGGRYTHPQTGVKTPYMDPGKVVVRSSQGRLDATYGAIPNIGELLGHTGPNLMPEIPGRLSSVEGGYDLFTNVWMTPDGRQLMGGVGARPLLIPTAIDTFGCLDTQL